MRAGYWPIIAILGLLLSTGARASAAPTPEVRQTLAPTGKLRVGLILGVPAQVIRDSASGEMKGVAFDLGKELARRMAVPFEPVLYPSIGALLDGGRSGNWDVAVMGFNPSRAKEWDFSPPHLEIEFSYLVPSGSSISTLAEVDRPGVRVAVAEGGQADRLLTSAIKVATLIRSKTNPDALEMLKFEKADAIAANKPILFDISNRVPGFRVLDGRFATDQQHMVIPKGRALGMDYVRTFVEAAKSEGFVKAAVERAGIRGAVVTRPQ
jgi:polar amino acid transport system substrate-binding protein